MNDIGSFKFLLSKDPTPGAKDRVVFDKNTYRIPGWVFDKDDEYLDITKRGSIKLMNSFGYSKQILYDILILGLLSIDDRPKCKICGKPVEFVSLKKGYKTVCCDECKREHTKNIMTSKWKDENYRNRLSLSHIEWASKEENKEQLRKNSLKVWEREGYRKKQSESHIEWAKDENNREQLRRNSLKVWENEEYRKKQTISHMEFAKNNPDKIKCGTTGFIISNKSSSGEIKFDSTWERDFVLLVNEIEEVISIERSDLFIPYMIDDIQHNYFPDFKLIFNNGKVLLIEIKANWMLERDPKTLKKIEAGFKYVEEHREISEYLVLKDENLCDGPHYVNFNKELAKQELLKHY